MIDDRLSYPLSFRDSISVLYSGIVLVQAFLRMVKAPRLKTGKSLGTIQSQGFPASFFLVEISGIEPLTS